MKQKIKNSLVLLIGLIFILGPLINLNNDNSLYSNQPKISDSEDVNLDETSLSIQYGSNVQEDKSYIFSGEFYDTTNLLREWSETAYLETQFVLDPDVYANDTITDLDNTEIQSPDNSSYTISEGSLYQNGTLDLLDDDPSIFNSSYDHIEATDYDLNYGKYVNGTIYNGSFSFDGEVGNIGEEISIVDVDQSGAGCSIEIIDKLYEHRTVMRINSTPATSRSYFHSYLDDPTYGTVEFWSLQTNSMNRIAFFNENSERAIYLNLHSYSSLDTWTHYRIDFDCSTDRYSLYVDGVLEIDHTSFDYVSNNMDFILYGALYSDASTMMYYDAFGYSWLSNYTIGDNLVGYFADMNYVDGDYVQYSSSYETDVPSYEEFLLSQGNLYSNRTIGNYFGTYTFKDLTSNPFYEQVVGSTCYSDIVDFDGHSYVLKFVDNDATGYIYSQYNFPEGQVSGTVEFWFAYSNSVGWAIWFKQFGGSNALNMYIDSNILYIRDDTVWDNVATLTENQWYHLRFDFECSTNAYLGLTQYTYDAYLNSTKLGNFAFQNGATPSNIGTMAMSTITASIHTCYLDSLDFSWSSGYYYGRSLDIEYDTSALMNIDDDYMSFNSTEAYHYPATYSFENDASGLSGTSIPFISYYNELEDTNITVIDEYMNHRKVLDVYDNNAVSSMIFSTADVSSTGTTVVEYWININDETNLYYFQPNLFCGGDFIIYPVFRSVGTSITLRVYDGSWTDLKTGLQKDTWYHNRIVLDIDNDEYDWYVDGEQVANDFGFYNPTINNFTKLNCYVSPASINYHVYLDAFGFDGDPDYQIGDNNYWRYYQGTFDFEDVDTGDLPVDWIDSSTGDCQVIVAPTFGNHSKVLNCSDVSSSYYFSSYVEFDNEVNGTIEFWVLSTDVYKTNEFRFIDDGGSIGIEFKLDDNSIWYYDGSWHDLGVGVSNDTWYHVRIDFECRNGLYEGLSHDTYNISIDGTPIGTCDFRNDIDDVIKFQIIGATSDSNYNCYVDAIGLDFHTGNFTGTYSFENDADGSDPAGWNIVAETENGDISVVDSFNGHNKVIKLFDNDSSNFILSNNLDGQYTTGIVEFWVCMNDTSKKTMFDLKYYGYGASISEFGINAGYLAVYDGSYHNLAPAVNDVWYHFKAYFDCNNDYVEVVVNGKYYGKFSIWGDYDYCNRVYLATHSSLYGYVAYFDAIGYSWDSGYDIGDNLDDNVFGYDTGDNLKYNIYPTVSLTFTSQLNMDLRDLYLYYSFKINVNQTINMSFYNFHTLQWDLINSSIPLDFYSNGLLLNSSYYNSSGFIKINIIGINETEIFNEFQFYLEMLYVRNSPIFEMESVIECSLTDNFFYSYMTNITQSVEVYIYNFTSSSYFLIENSSYLSYNLNYTSIEPDYHDSTAIKIKIRAINQTYNDFAFYLEVLKVMNNTQVYFTCYIELEEFHDYLLHFNATAWYYTSLYTQANFSIYDFENEEWILINSSYNNISYFASIYTETTSDMYDLINEDHQILFRFQAFNVTNVFDLYLDKLEVKTYRKLLLSCEKTFTLLGTWKYRFHIPEEDYSTSWYYFDVVLKEDNVEMISESNFLTEWEFVGGYDINNMYQSDFSTDTWSLSDSVSEENMSIEKANLGNYLNESGIYPLNQYIIYDTYYSISDTVVPSGICWNGTNFLVVSNNDQKVYVYTSSFIYTGNSYSISDVSSPIEIVWDGSYFYITENSEVYKYDSNFNLQYSYYPIQVSEAICWDGTYFYTIYSYLETVYVYTSSWVYTGISYSISETSNPSGLETDGTYFYVVSNADNKLYKYDSGFNFLTSYSISEVSGAYGICYVFPYFHIVSSNNERIYAYYGDPHSVSKFYQSNDHVYMQTNETETISMYSDISTLNFESGDKIEIIFNTTSDSEINFLLMDSTIELKDFVLSEQGNINYNTRTVTFNVDADYEVNRFKFSSIFDDTDNLIVLDINIYRYDESSDVYSYEVNPSGLKTIYLDYPVNYTYSVYEDDVLKDTGYIYTSETLQTIVYERIDQQVIYITYHDTNNEYLEFQNYQTFANFTLDGVEYDNQTLTNDILYVDVETQIDFMIYDSFNTLIKETTRNAQTHVDIILSVFSLKIKNEATKNITYILSKGTIDKSGNMFPDEIAEFSISIGNYFLNYINYEDGIEKSYNISLSDNTLFSIETIYSEIYFAPFLANGMGLSFESVRFYINGSRKDFGFNTITSDYINITVLDFFNQTAFTEIINTNGVNEYNIYLELYYLKITNKATETINYTISKGSLDEIGEILVDEIIQYLFVPGDYEFFYTNNENGETDLISVNLIDDYTITVNTSYHDIYFAPFLINGLGLDHSILKFYINGSRKDFGFNTISSSYINITILDFFNQTAFTEILYTIGLNEYNIYINLKSLKIQNRASEIVNYTLGKGSISQTGDILPDEIIEYLAISGDYILTYTNQENMETGSTTISLTEDVVFMINTTYYQVYFSVFNYDGLGLDNSLFRFYINGLRKDFGFTTLSRDINNLVVKDFFNATLKDIDVDLSGYTEYNLIVEVYTLFILNNYNRTIKITIEREGTSISLEQIIPSRSGLECRFLPGIEYEISAYEQNGTFIESETIELDTQYEIVDFGFYEQEIPEYPDFNQSNILMSIIMITVLFIIGVSIVLYIAYKYYKRTNNLIKNEKARYLNDLDRYDNFTNGRRII